MDSKDNERNYLVEVIRALLVIEGIYFLYSVGYTVLLFYMPEFYFLTNVSLFAFSGVAALLISFELHRRKRLAMIIYYIFIALFFILQFLGLRVLFSFESIFVWIINLVAAVYLLTSQWRK